jgi:membrane protein implicated in regulation of membrane protease activity
VVDQYLVGKLGSVVRTVRGGRLPGEIQVVLAGEPTLYLAYSDEVLEAGTRIKIVGSRGSRQVDVEAWPRRH